MLAPRIYRGKGVADLPYGRWPMTTRLRSIITPAVPRLKMIHHGSGAPLGGIELDGRGGHERPAPWRASQIAPVSLEGVVHRHSPLYGCLNLVICGREPW